MLTLERKIDELNAKIDALSQHILKVEQQVSRPGMLIGETSPSPVPNAATHGDRVRRIRHQPTALLTSSPGVKR